MTHCYTITISQNSQILSHNFTTQYNFQGLFTTLILVGYHVIKNHKKTFNQEDDAPEPLGEEGWLDLNLPVQLMRNLIHLKMAKPTPIQRIACPGKAF